MIQELKIKNFLSFRDQAELSFEATKEKVFEDYLVVEVAPGVRLLRAAMVLGSNASGKSNVLKAFEFLRTFWFANHESLDEQTNVTPFLLDDTTPFEPSCFELKFWVNGVKYLYILQLNCRYVEKESLYIYKTIRPTLLFDRHYDKGRSFIKLNNEAIKISSIAEEELGLKCLPNMSFFGARNKVNVSLPMIDAARDWMRLQVMPCIKPTTNLRGDIGNRILNDDKLKKYLLDFIQHADFNISRFQLDRSNMNSCGSSTIFQHSVSNARGFESYPLPFSLQSEGTQRIIGIAVSIYQALSTNSFLLIDEIESSLHPDLVEYLIEQYLKTNSESQLLFTTHYDPLLNTINDLLRKDSVWFTEKDESGNTSLYSLVDFKGLNKLSSFQRSYRNGRFGALPKIK
ncbi:MAG: ATP-binding protein [Muribaculaceae bacterium]|nr:ATP-binding protein [Muribaculaceae bacterium]